LELQPRQANPPVPVAAQARPPQSTPHEPQLGSRSRLTQLVPQQRLPPPQPVPLGTLRLQLRRSVLGREVQLPAPQMRSVIVRDWVPLSSHAFAKPPQLPQAPTTRVPQLLPSVLRVQDCIWVLITSVHAPPPQVGVVTIRDCVPPSSHVEANPPHAPQAPGVAGPHGCVLQSASAQSVSPSQSSSLPLLQAVSIEPPRHAQAPAAHT
jgi:hypothetical protein